MKIKGSVLSLSFLCNTRLLQVASQCEVAVPINFEAFNRSCKVDSSETVSDVFREYGHYSTAPVVRQKSTQSNVPHAIPKQIRPVSPPAKAQIESAPVISIASKVNVIPGDSVPSSKRLSKAALKNRKRRDKRHKVPHSETLC